jgi:hypothetical protein
MTGFIAIPVCSVYNYWASFAIALDARFLSVDSFIEGGARAAWSVR